MIHNYLGKTREVEYTCSGISWSSYCTWSGSIRSNLFGGIITELKPATAEESYHIDLYHFRFVIQIQMIMITGSDGIAPSDTLQQFAKQGHGFL